MPRISEEEIKAVREKADIVDIVGRYIQVHKQGKGYVAVCPFHDDHSPSLHINQDMQIYKCFVCNNGGNVFTFIQNYEKVSFPEAVSKVANLVGIQLSYEPTKNVVAKDPHKEALYNVLNETIRFTMYQLNSQDAKDQKDYLMKRGLTNDVLEYFQIGYNPLKQSLYKFLNAKNYKDEDIINSNVCRMSENGMQDVFAARITFPIHDNFGNPIGFSARSLDPEAVSKYINTTETELFIKGNIVYNYHRAKQASRKEGKVYICEGVTDVIAFYRAGIENVVCTLGTACTKEQMRLLKSLAPRWVFCYDGDEAGQNATWKACKIANAMNTDVRVIHNKTGLDPDEILSKQGADGLKNILKEEISWMEFVLEYLKSRTNLNSYLEKKEMAKKAMDEIALLNDEADKQYFTEQLSKLTGLQLTYAKHTKTHRPYEKRALKVPNGLRETEYQVLKMMISSKNAISQFENELGYLTDQDTQTLAMMIVSASRHHDNIDALQLIDQTNDQSIKDLIAKLVTDSGVDVEYDEEMMRDAIRTIKIAELTKQSDKYKEELDKDLNQETRQLVLDQYAECLRELRRQIDEKNS